MHDDWSLMQRVAEGDRTAVAELYDRFASLVYRMAYQLLPTKGAAEDAVQEVFVRLWQSAGHFDPNRASLVTWVMLITRRYLVDQLRRVRVRPKFTGFDEHWSAEDESLEVPGTRLQLKERRQRLREQISALPELQRQIVERAYLGGKTLREIGQELNKPIGTVKSALSRALVVLRERVPSEEGIA